MISPAEKRVTTVQTVTLPPATGANTQRIRFIDSTEVRVRTSEI